MKNIVIPESIFAYPESSFLRSDWIPGQARHDDITLMKQQCLSTSRALFLR